MIHAIVLGTGIIFGGGSANELALALTKTNSPVAICIDEDRIYRAANLPASNEELAKFFAGQFDLVRPAASGSSFYPKALPFDLFVRKTSSFFARPDRPKTEIVRDKDSGRWSVHTGKEGALTLEALGNSPLSRRLRSHWFFGRAKIAIEAEGVSEGELILLVAQALGAELRVGKTYDIMIDPSRLKEGAKALTEKPFRFGDPVLDDYYPKVFLAATGINAMTDEEVLRFYDEPGNEQIVGVKSGSPMLTPGKLVLDRYLAQANVENPGPGVLEAVERVRQQADFSKPFTVRLSNQGYANVRLMSHDGKTAFNL